MIFTFNTPTKIDAMKIGTHKVIGRALTEEESKAVFPRCLASSRREYLGELKELYDPVPDSYTYSLNITYVQRNKKDATSHMIHYGEHQEFFTKVLKYDYSVAEFNILEEGGPY